MYRRHFLLNDHYLYAPITSDLWYACFHLYGRGEFSPNSASSVGRGSDYEAQCCGLSPTVGKNFSFCVLGFPNAHRRSTWHLQIKSSVTFIRDKRYLLWPFRSVWLLVCCLYKEVYLQIFKCVSFWLHGCCGEWEGGPVNHVNHTSWVAVVTPTDRHKSVRNCCLIELFCGVVCVVTLPFWHFCWCRGFCHRTGSDLPLFVFRERSFERKIAAYLYLVQVV